jgi:hypothetical protein
MASNNGQFEQANSSGFPDEMIRRFLLGDLNATERPVFEQRLLVDDALAARVRLAELELADDYAYRQLSSAERDLITENFLLTTDRERKVRVSRSLRDHFAPAAVAGGSAAYINRLSAFFGLSQLAWRFAFAIVVLLLLFGAALLVIKEPRLARQITNSIVPRRRLAPGVPHEASHANNPSAPEHQTTSSPMPVHDQTAASPQIVSVALRPMASSPGDATPWISLPKGDEDIARLQLAVKPDQVGRYHAELLTSERQPVLSGELIKAPDNGAQVNFDVPARLLKSGDYQIRLSRDNAGANENLGTYYFRVQ